MSPRSRWILTAVLVLLVLALWIPPVRSELDSPPPPLFAKPATVILAFLALAASAAAPIGRGGRLLIAMSLVAGTVAAWIAARIFWGGYLPY
jgi:hypothetical protein